ncbi:hypothetical protein Tsubulata_025858 [Turnera subulata]|uniref:E3 ubiquitin-protein ligase LIN n=1 Tax=Turnera subulata TaxID=218843 RepID=A0A9Q0F8Q5_9ROSI|nr:hypothetical protein Tsubulata_025858 [Turnera subulata]
MASSLQQLLSEEGFEHRKFLQTKKPVKPRDRTTRPEDSVVLPIHICYDQKSSPSWRQKTDKASTRKGSSILSSRRVSSDLERVKLKASSKGDEPAIDEVAIRAVVSILGGYIGRYVKDSSFRQMIRDKCNSCLLRGGKDSDNEIFTNLEMGMESIDGLVEDETGKELRMETLKTAIHLLGIVASLNSKHSRKGKTCGVPNSNLSACAQLYLSIVYKLEKNDRISARHLLQVFCDSPFLARTHLLPDLWEHFFLPHLLHLKIWYHKELQVLSESQFVDKEKEMKALNKVYNNQMDIGSIQFALYYKDWLKVGGKAPSLPAVPLPPRPKYALSRRISSDSYASQSSINKNLYQAVFGPTLERRSMDLTSRNSASMDVWGEEKAYTEEEYNKCNYATDKKRTHQRSSSVDHRISKHELWSETQKSDHIRPFSCQSMLPECVVSGSQIVRSGSMKDVDDHTLLPSGNVSRAINTICCSDSLSECEIAIHVISKAWLDSHGDHIIEVALSKAAVIEGLLEVLFASADDEILELVISILAELVARKEESRLIILNADPQLKVFMKLLSSSSLFLKAAVLLHLLKPMAKQMISIEWVALVLRVLEFGDQLQTLFTVRCMPQRAALYLLDQLLTGFNEDGNLENANQVISLGGLSLLVRTFEMGDISERKSAAMLMSCCIRADGSCRNYLAENLNKLSLLELIVLGIEEKSNGNALALLTELLCLSRRKKVTEILATLDVGWSGLNTMHIFLILLQRALPEERPLVASILLQLDLLGDLSKSSLYREEAVEAIVESLDCQKYSTKVQEQSSRALVMLGGCFSNAGETTTEEWLLQQAGFHEGSHSSFHSREIMDRNLNEEEEAMEDWQRKVAVTLLNSGGERFLSALSNAIANGIPSLAQSSLFTVAWMSRIVLSNENAHFPHAVFSITELKLLESSCHSRALDQRVLWPSSLQHLIKNPECVSMLSTLNKELIDPLRNAL